MIVSEPRRGGFTLLEVLLASAIGILLLAALYMAFDVALKQADAGRDVVARGDLSRDIVNRMTIDLSCCIGAMPPKSGGGIPEEADPSSTPSTSSASSESSSAETAAGVAAGTKDLALSETVIAADLVFQGGLFGQEKQVTLFVSRVPPALSQPETADPLMTGMIDMRPDLCRVTYYMGRNGLCRQVKAWVTAEDDGNTDEVADLIAEEVTDVTFSYFGSSGWQNTWTGSDAASDGASVLGPPRAIMITMTIRLAGSTETKTFSHVIPVRAAIGLQQPPTTEEEIPDTATTGITP